MSTKSSNMKGRKKQRAKKSAKVYNEVSPQYMIQTRAIGTGFPDTTRTTLQYTDTFVISGASYQTIYSFRGNSVYDPDYTSAGHQPAYFDTFSSVYSRYKVYGARIHVSLFNITSKASCFAIIPSSNALALGAAQYALLDLPRSRWVPVGSSAIEPARISHNASTCQILGLTSRQVEDDDYSAIVSANPSSLWYYNLYLFNVDSAVLAPSVSVVVQIFYDVKFYDRQDITPSFSNVRGSHDVLSNILRKT